MSNKKITFDPDSGTPYAVNLTINTGATVYRIIDGNILVQPRISSAP